MKKYILSIDQGTTSTRAILFDKKVKLLHLLKKKLAVFTHTMAGLSKMQ
jgi:glycerol kinase